MRRGVSPSGLLAAALLVCASACQATRVGAACATDDDCGPGFDCFRERCTLVCTRDEECGAGESCQRYRCLTPQGATPEADRPAAPAAAAGGGTPDPTVVELRALRREIELVQQGQARIIGLLEQRQGLEQKGDARPPLPPGARPRPLLVP